MKIKNYRFNMEGYELVDKAMNVGYRMLLGEEITYEPNDSDKVEDMVFIPDPTQSEMELANDLLEYFIEEDSIVIENKNGPYFGPEKDRTRI